MIKLINIKGQFKLEHSTNSLNVIVYRKINGGNSNEKYLDLIFSGVQFMQIPFSFDCSQIEEVENFEMLTFKKQTDWTYKTFKIITQTEDYYILASNLLIKNNNLESYGIEHIPNEADLIIEALKNGVSEEEVLRKYKK